MSQFFTTHSAPNRTCISHYRTRSRPLNEENQEATMSIHLKEGLFCVLLEDLHLPCCDCLCSVLPNVLLITIWLIALNNNVVTR